MCRKNQRKFQTTYYEDDDIHKQFLVKLLTNYIFLISIIYYSQLLNKLVFLYL